MYIYLSQGQLFCRRKCIIHLSQTPKIVEDGGVLIWCGDLRGNIIGSFMSSGFSKHDLIEIEPEFLPTWGAFPIGGGKVDIFIK